MLIFVGLWGVATAAGRPRLDGREAPRATDLLRAETLARQAERRLHQPPGRRGGWVRGGTGWAASARTPPEREPSIIIRTAPVRRRLEH